MDLSALPLVIAIFHRASCGACDEFLPRARAVAARWPCVPTALVNSQLNDGLAAGLQVYYTPTTFVLRHGRIARRLEGSADDETIEALYRGAAGECRR